MSDTPARGERALVPLLALTLLVGVVAVGSVGIFLAGTDGIEETKETAETERVEQGFVQLGKDVDTISLSGQDSRTTDFALEDDAAAVRKEDAGRITITVTDREDPIVNRTIGALEYRDGETVLAYQAGGVWHGTGRETRMVSAPEIHYRHGSLTLPIMSVTGEDRISGQRLTATTNRTISPLNDVSTVDGKLVTITIESEYYTGWAEFFEGRTGNTSVTVDHANETVIVDLGQPKIDGNFDDAVVAQGGVYTPNGNGCINGTIVASGTIDADDCDDGHISGGGDDVSMQPIDEAINMTVEAAAENATEIDPAEVDTFGTLDNGTYFVDGNFHLTDSIQFDVSEGDVTLVVKGHVIVDGGEIEVVGTGDSDGVARVYTTDDVAIGQGSASVNDGGNGNSAEGDPSKFQLYGRSDMNFALGQGSYTGTVYAPREEPANETNEAADGILESSNNCEDIDDEVPDVCIGQGGAEFTGSIIAGSISVEQKGGLTYDRNLQSTEPTLALDGVVLPPPLTYLHVVVHEIEVAEA